MVLFYAPTCPMHRDPPGRKLLKSSKIVKKSISRKTTWLTLIDLRGTFSTPLRSPAIVGVKEERKFLHLWQKRQLKTPSLHFKIKNENKSISKHIKKNSSFFIKYWILQKRRLFKDTYTYIYHIIQQLYKNQTKVY